MPNIKSRINRINSSKNNTAIPSTEREPKNCSRQGLCSKGCILDGKCNTESVVYRAKCHDEDGNMKEYVGMTEGTFKERVQGHYTSFNNLNYRHRTTLSEHIWSLQDNLKTYQLHWEILEKVNKFSPGNKYCNLCISEKKWILKCEGSNRLNKNEEFVAKCPHMRKFKLGRIENTKDIDLLKHTIIPNTDLIDYNVKDKEIEGARRSNRIRKKNVKFTGTEWEN